MFSNFYPIVHNTSRSCIQNLYIIIIDRKRLENSENILFFYSGGESLLNKINCNKCNYPCFIVKYKKT